jgi:hypothetical protein
MPETISIMMKFFLLWLLLFGSSLMVESWGPGRGFGIGLFVFGNGLLALATRKRISERFIQAADSYNQSKSTTPDAEGL